MTILMKKDDSSMMRGQLIVIGRSGSGPLGENSGHTQEHHVLWRLWDGLVISVHSSWPFTTAIIREHSLTIVPL